MDTDQKNLNNLVETAPKKSSNVRIQRFLSQLQIFLQINKVLMVPLLQAVQRLFFPYRFSHLRLFILGILKSRTFLFYCDMI